MTSFSERLKELRKKNNLTQQELADKVGTNRVNVTKWETGRTEPTLESIIKLAHIFEISVDYLLGNTDIHYPNFLTDSKTYKEKIPQEEIEKEITKQLGDIARLVGIYSKKNNITWSKASSVYIDMFKDFFNTEYAEEIEVRDEEYHTHGNKTETNDTK